MLRILIVNDEPGVLQVLSRLFTVKGWAVTLASEANAALARLAECDFDAVLTDLVLGAGPTGVDVLLRRDRRNAAAKFVIISGRCTVGDCREAFLAGASDFLEKPVSPARLLGVFGSADVVDTDLVGDMLAPVDTPSRAQLHVRRTMDRIRVGFADKSLTLEKLARAEDVSVEHLCRIFQAERCRPVVRYLREVRSTEAARLLLHTGMPMRGVASVCGFRSSRDLGREFVRRHGCSPSCFRARAALVGR
jgi:YesN/AraC family two-component response regulator